MSAERDTGPEELIQSHFDGSLSPEGERALQKWLASSPANLDFFVRQLEVHAALWENSSGAEAERAAGNRGQWPLAGKSPRLFRRTVSWRAGRLSGRAWWWIGGAAAAACILFAAWFHLREAEGPPAETEMQLVAVSGEVRVARTGAALVAREGLALRTGESVTTAAGARATIRYGGTAVEMNQNSELALGRAEQGLDVRFRSGEIYVRAAGPMTVNAGHHDEVLVTGTEFEVSRRADATTLRVAEGQVIFGGGGRAVAVGGLQASRVRPGEAPGAPEALPAGAVAPWRTPAAPADSGTTGLRQSLEPVVFTCEFDVVPPGAQTHNELVRLKELGGEVTAIASQPFTGGRPAWSPDCTIDYGRAFGKKPRTDALYVIPKNVEIRIRIKAERPGKCGFSQIPTNPTFESEHFYTGEIQVGTEWRVVVLHAADMVPYRQERHTRDLLPGVGINGFDFNGFQVGRLWVDRLEVRSLPDTQEKPAR